MRYAYPCYSGARGLGEKGIGLNLSTVVARGSAVAALTLAAPAAAAPRHYKVLGKARHHLGKPEHKQLIAVRHGHRIHWFSKTHGLPKHKLPPIKLSANVKFAHAGIRFAPSARPRSRPRPAPGAATSELALMTPDGMSYVQSYGGLSADVMSCVGHDGGNRRATVLPEPDLLNNAGAHSVDEFPLEVATFMDGEWMALCTVPDDNGTGGSEANTQHAPYVVYQQGFPCEAAVGPALAQFRPHRQDQRLARVLADLQRDQSDPHGADDLVHRPAGKR